jgi:hypothetical protein
MVKHNCRICKKKTDQRIISEFSDRLPPNLALLECQGCGVLGVEMIEVNDVQMG